MKDWVREVRENMDLFVEVQVAKIAREQGDAAGERGALVTLLDMVWDRDVLTDQLPAIARRLQALDPREVAKKGGAM